jgi:hypothetical protein
MSPNLGFPTAPRTGTEPITGSQSYKVYLTLNSDGSYSSSMSWYSGTSCAGLFQVYYSTMGTYSLADITGSTTQKLVTFTMTFSPGSVTPDMMVAGNGVRTSFNNDCGGTSPYTGGANATDGSHQYTGTLSCMNETFPNSVLRNKFYNIVSWDGTNFYIGANYTGENNVPGSFTVNTVAASPTIYLHE